jgi:hypothetical protein
MSELQSPKLIDNQRFAGAILERSEKLACVGLKSVDPAARRIVAYQQSAARRPEIGRSQRQSPRAPQRSVGDQSLHECATLTEHVYEASLSRTLRVLGPPVQMCDALSRNAPKLAAGVEILLANCLEERMSQRLSTRLACDSRFNNHILPKWGDKEITDLQARVVELWLMSLALAPKTRVHVRGLLHQLWDYAMFRQDVPLERNPMELVTIKGATKRIRQPRSLTVEEFQKFVAELGEPVRTIAPGVRLLRTED